jgi:hypothetical protein
MNLDFPLIYCNGDSYSDETYHESLSGSTYPYTVASHCNGFVINKSISGSCNRRIIRTSLHDLILQRQINPNQQIIALIGLSFELRSEIWIDQKVSNISEESNFVTHTFSGQINWRENLLQGHSIETPNRYKLDSIFYEKYSQGRAYFFSPYAERINLLSDLIMLKFTLDSLGIDFLIFQSPKAEQLESDYLLDFFKQQLSTDNRFFDLEKFGFCNWCHISGFTPIDLLDRPEIAHYGPDAHHAFAEQIIIPQLLNLSIL